MVFQGKMRTKKLSIKDILRTSKNQYALWKNQQKIKGLKGGFLKFSKNLRIEILPKLVYLKI